ncbi:MAG: MBL fold metallo-hydrolase [Desulfobacterales bacterium]
MRIYKHKLYGPVNAWELGWSPVGRPVMTVHFYIVGRVMIDTGLSHMRSAALNIARRYGVKAVLLTHYHEDHSGNAAAIKEQLNIPVYALPLTCRKMRNPSRIFPYQHLMWGAADPLKPAPLPAAYNANGFSFIPVHTPGHSKDHTVFLEPRQGWLFSGDLYLSERIKYFRADENIADQIKSLRKVLVYDFETLFCAHRPEIEDGRQCLMRKLDYLENFYGSVAELADQGMDENQIMGQLKLKEVYSIKLMCWGNVSMKNMVRSVIKTRGEVTV